MMRTVSIHQSLGDPDDLSPSGPNRAQKQAGLVVLCVLWVVLGLIGHDPWKTEDATTFGVALEAIRSHDWIVTKLAGETYIGAPSLVYALAAFFGSVLAPWALPLHDAARVAAGVMLALTLVLVAATARELYGRTLRWLPVLVFAGSVGLWDRAHQLSPELGMLLGIALAQYGLAIALRRPGLGGIVMGAGIAVAFLARGILGPVWILATAVALAAFSRWQTRAHLQTVAVALATAVLIAGLWPLTLVLKAPDHLGAWWAAQSTGDFFAPWSAKGDAEPLFMVKNLFWYAWPALPLVAWTIWTRGRGFNGGLTTPGVLLPATMAVTIFCGITVMAEPRAIHAMPLLLPLALLAALEVDTLPRGFSGALDWFGILTLGLLAAIVWWLWWDARIFGMSGGVANIFHDTESGYRPTFRLWAMLVSVFLTFGWIALVRPARRSNRRTILNWTAGMTLVWGLATTIWLPYLDSRRSYRSVADAVAGTLPAKGCVASRALGEPQRALLHYFAGLTTIREEVRPDHRCPVLLVQQSRNDRNRLPASGWTMIWHGHRRGDDTENFVLLRRNAS